MAHNWLNSPARSQFASTVNPTIPTQTGEPHVQVHPGQDFQIEWVVGHDGDAYFVLLKNDADAYKNMLMHKTVNLEDYLNNAPAAQNVSASTTRWQKYHRKYNDYTLNADNKINDSFFSKCMRPNETEYLPRPPTFEGSFSGAPSVATRNATRYVHCVYKTAQPGVNSDRRVQYTNAKYPWIIAVHKYRYFANQPSRPDFALFQFPAGTRPGDYIVQWQWRGYYDVVDVEVLNTTVPKPTLPYGTAPPTRKANTKSQYKRIDHCMFLGPNPAGNCQKVLTDTLGCEMSCDRSTDFGCNGVGIVPAVLPPWVYKGLKNVSLVPDYPQCNRANMIKGATFTDRICFPIQQRALNTAIPENSFQTSTDPEDPIFYSTCLFRVKPSALATPPPPPPPREASFRFGSICVDCAEATRSTYEHYLPVWNMTEACKNCDADFDKTKVAKPMNWSEPLPFAVLNNTSCRNTDDVLSEYKCVNKTTCAISLAPLGARDVSLRDCYELAKANPKCSRAVWKTSAYQADPAVCSCWTNTTAANACCGACVWGGKSSYYTSIVLTKDPPFV